MSITFYTKELFVPTWPVFNRVAGSKKKNAPKVPHGALLKHYYYGRNALWWGTKTLGLQKGDTVLVPAYTNDLLTQVFIKQGLNVRFFDVTENLEVTVDVLEKHMDSSVKAVAIIHYFGWIQPKIEAIQAWCKEKNVFLIEDCALTPASYKDDAPVGSWGDISIFSLKKYWPVSNGGILGVNNSDLRVQGPQTVAYARKDVLLEYISKKTSALFTKSLLAYKILGYGIGLAKRITKRAHTVPTGSNELDISHLNVGMSEGSVKVLYSSDNAAIAAIRRENFAYLHSLLTAKHLKGREDVFPLIEGVSPLCYPLIVSEGRDELVAILRRTGIGAGAWWDNQDLEKPKGMFPVSEKLRKQLITIPIHQSLTKEHMEFINTVIDYAITHNTIKI